MSVEDKSKLVQFFKCLASTQGNITINQGIAVFEDGTTYDISKLAENLIVGK